MMPEKKMAKHGFRVLGFAVAFGPVLEFDDESAIGGALAGKETVAINHLAFSYGGGLPLPSPRPCVLCSLNRTRTPKARSKAS